jgi:AbrB family looped-hinge helix DNA binding protein
MKATVAERGQVTIPKKLRERLGITPGTVLDFECVEGRLQARKVSTTDPVELVYGCLRGIPSTDGFIEDIRGAA